MDVRTLCLGVLSFGDATGYDIKKYFEASFSNFFPAGYGSIYPALAQVKDLGYVTCAEQAQDKLPDKKVYHITEAGKEFFANSVAAGEGNHKLRSEFLVQAYFSHFLSANRIDELVEKRLNAWDEQAATLSDHLANLDVPDGVKFTIGFGKAMSEAASQYVRENRHLLVQEADDAGSSHQVAA